MKIKNLEDIKQMLYSSTIIEAIISGSGELILKVETHNEEQRIISFKFSPNPKMQGNVLSIDSVLNITVVDPE